MTTSVRREDIIAQLLAIVGDVPGPGPASVATALRNHVAVPDDLLPAAIVFEGDEETVEQDQILGRRGITPTRVHMTPLVLLAAMGHAHQIGTTMNAWRGAIIQAIVTDETLLGIIQAPSGRVIYQSMESEIVRGERTIARYVLKFQITYILSPGAT